MYPSRNVATPNEIIGFVSGFVDIFVFLKEIFLKKGREKLSIYLSIYHLSIYLSVIIIDLSLIYDRLKLVS
jgi:hypothetical protein